MKNLNVAIVKDIRPPTKAGMHHRLLCMTGENKGLSYYIKSNRLVIGRGENVDIKIMDGKCSKVHAEIVKVGKDFVLTDLKSQNGTMVNDLKVTQYTLKDTDKIIIGQTVFKYSVLNIAETEVVPEVKSDENEEGEKESKNKKPLLFLVFSIFVILMIFSGNEEGNDKRKKPEGKRFQEVTDEFTAINKKKESENKEVQEKLDMIIHRGLREMREGNYFRAMSEFNLALVMSPNNARSSFYLNKTKQSLDREIEQNLIKARRDQEALKFMSAVQAYCNIIRLLEGYSDDERFMKAELEIKQLEEKMGLSEGDIKCSSYQEGSK